MSKKKLIPIKYTSRDFNSIRRDLIEYAQRYYPDSYKDFSEGSFGSLMVENVSYIGDMLSFYLDYQVNESFLDTSVEYNNIIRHGRQLGYKFKGAPSAYGECDFYVEVPANNVGFGPDQKYIPILKKGAACAAGDGNTFVLVEDLDFNAGKRLTVVGKQNTTTGNPTSYIIKMTGRVASGEFGTEEVTVEGFQRFRRIRLLTPDIVEVISVFDQEGHQYFEVPYLSQDVVYRDILNRGRTSDPTEPASIIKPFAVPRRFITERSRRNTVLQFGYGSDSEINQASVADPTEVVMKIHGKAYTSDTSFDPTRLLDTDKFGIAPSNTVLVIRYRRNSTRSSNAGAGSVTQMGPYTLQFKDPTSLSKQARRSVEGSLEVNNPDPMVGSVSAPSRRELKESIAGVFAAQNRAVTEQDYKALIYAMPPQFGAVRRCALYRDSDSFRRNLNLYVIGADNNGHLVSTNSTIKQNLKTWIGQNKIINDTIDVLDAKIVNIQVEFTAISAVGVDKYDVQVSAVQRIKALLAVQFDIGEPFDIGKIYNTLNKTRGIVDVTKVKAVNVFGGAYSNIGYDIREHTTPDGRYVNVPKNVILEVKYLDTDIKGTIT